MMYSEDPGDTGNEELWQKIQDMLKAGENDAIVVIWGPDADIPTAIETIEERMEMAFEGVPNETRKSFPDGTTIFERVLPGSDRMYPDTDSPPIPLTEEYIETLRKRLPVITSDRFKQFMKWGIPEDCHKYILSKNMVPLIEKICECKDFDQRQIGIFLGQKFKRIEGSNKAHKNFNHKIIADLFNYLCKKKLHIDLAGPMLEILYEHPKMRYESVLTTLNFKTKTMDELLAPVDFLFEKYSGEGPTKIDNNSR